MWCKAISLFGGAEIEGFLFLGGNLGEGQRLEMFSPICLKSIDYNIMCEYGVNEKVINKKSNNLSLHIAL
jgi:hypothetical protein